MIKTLIQQVSDAGISLYLQDGKLRYNAVKGSLTDEIKAKIVDNKAQIITWLTENNADEIVQKTPHKAEKLPLSFAQKRLWFIDQFEHGSAQYNMPGMFHLRGDFDLTVFTKVVQTIINRHEVLRTNIMTVNGEPQQLIRAQVEPNIQFTNLSNIEEQQKQSKIERLTADDANAVFDLENDVLLRLHVIKLSEQEHQILFNMHHIASDAWSMGILIEEFGALYTAFSQHQSDPLPPLKVQYADYAIWQHKWLQGDVLNEQLGYWKNQLNGIPDCHGLPLDKPRPVNQAYQGKTCDLPLSPEFTKQLNDWCLSQDVTLFMLLHTALSVLISRYANEEDIVIGTPVAGRSHQDSEGLIGFFVNTLVLRSDLSANPSFVELLQQNKQCLLQGLTHQHVPFEMLVDELKPTRSLAYNPLFQIMLTVNNSKQGEIDLEHLSIEAITQPASVIKFDLDLVATEREQGLLLQWNYNTALFEHQPIVRMLDNLQRLLKVVITQPQLPVGQIELLSDTERSLLLDSWNQTDVKFEHNLTIHQLFERQVDIQPDAVALGFEQQTLTYRQLNSQANQLAAYLLALGLKPDSHVGLCCERSIEMVVAIYAIMKAGGAYIPLDPNLPDARLNHMISDSGTNIVLTTESCAKQVDLIALEHLIVMDNAQTRVKLETCDQQNIPIERLGLTAQHLAYTIYTSGSTGQPKGACIEHQALHNRIEWMQQTYPLTVTDKILQKTPFTFDVSVWEFFWPLSFGAQLIVAKPQGHQQPDYLAQTIIDQQITVLHYVPSMLSVMLQTEDWSTCSSVKQVFCSGEALNASLVQQFYQTGTQAQLANLYGPTEAAIDVSYFDCLPEHNVIPIGKPINNINLYILNAQRQPVPLGAIGELYIGGIGLARGYLNQPELTANSFIPNPLSNQANDRLYKTGDLVRYLANGDIQYISRIDDQVKLRGLRIELGEIQHALLQIGSIKDAAVIAHHDQNEDKRLVAYVVSESSVDRHAIAQRIEDYQQQLGTQLPNYMVPASYIFVDALPLTANGKLDKKALPNPKLNQSQQPIYRSARTEIEQQLCQLWQTLLNVEVVGIDDNFFALGGDSIVSIVLVSRAKQLGMFFDVRQLFEFQTIASLAPNVGKESAVQAPQEPTVGKMPLLPVQQAFFARQLPVANHFNQSVFLTTPNGFYADQIKPLIAALYQRHDALRLRFENINEQTAGHFVPYSSELVNQACSIEDLSGLEQSKQLLRIEQLSQQLQQSFIIENGPLFKALYLHLGENRGRLLLVCHHLVVDGVSWRILLSDLQQGWQQLHKGQTLSLPLKSSSLAQWSEALHQYAHSELMNEERGYWLAQAAIDVQTLPLQQTSTTERQQVDFELSEQHTQWLLGQCNETYHTQINELLLAALLTAYTDWAGGHSVRINMEGHGRETLFEQLDISETVGWFTSMFPFVLSTNSQTECPAVIKQVKEQYRQLPNNGVGYGVLKYLAADPQLIELEAKQSQCDIEFNYLGQFDTGGNESQSFTLADEATGRNISLQNHSDAPINISGVVHQGRLSIDISADARCRDIAHFGERFEMSLNNIVRHCMDAKGGYTPSDFKLANIDMAALDQVQNEHPNLSKMYVATPMQSGLLFHSMLEGKGSYITQICCDMLGQLDSHYIKQAWQNVIDRHDSLRTSFVGIGTEQIHQIVAAPVQLPFNELDWTHVPQDDIEQQLQQLAAQDQDKGFDLAQPPLMRITLVKLTEQRYHFIWSVHHAIIDGWCTPIIFGEVLKCYCALLENKPPQLVPAVAYEQYIEWLGNQDLDKARTFWQDKLSGFNTPTELLIEQHSTNSEIKTLRLPLESKICEALSEKSRLTHSTMNVLLQLAWGYLLHRYSGQGDIVFGATLSGRPTDVSGIEKMIGLFINTVPVRVKFNHSVTIADLINNLHSDNVATDEFSYLPLTDIQNLSEVPNGTSMFDSLMVFENYPADEVMTQEAQNQTLSFDVDNVRSVSHSNYALTLVGQYHQGQLVCELNYNSGRFTQQRIERLGQHLKQILSSIAMVDVEKPITAVDIISATEHQQIMQWQPTANANAIQHDCIHQSFEHQVAQNPDRCAVSYQQQSFTYERLNQQANKMARLLVERGVKPDTLVGLCVERSIEMMVGILAILKAGGAYVPLDPNYPKARLEFILQDSEIELVITQQSLLDDIASDLQVLCIDDPKLNEIIESKSGDNLHIDSLNASNLAYVIYTSGSTGQPKGVLVEHRNVARLMQTTEAHFDFNEQDVWTLFHSCAFDFSVWEMWGALLYGGQLVVVPAMVAPDAQALCELIEQHQVTVLSQTPSAFYPLIPLLAGSAAADSLRYIVFGGESLDYQMLAGWYQYHQHADTQLVNMYGITETTVHVTFRAITSEDVNGHSSIIGKPLSDLNVWVCNDSMALQPIGVTGELYIGGGGLTRGYLNRPELNQQRFVNNPFIAQDELLYRTGDLVRWLDDGQLEYVGRCDTQVKIRGFRIELGEIQSVLNDFSQVKEAVVISDIDNQGSQRLVAYVVPTYSVSDDQPAKATLDEACKIHLSNQLPQYMVPQLYVYLTAMPLTANGKLDYRALPQVQQVDLLKSTFVAPRNAVEQQLVEIWQDLLQLEQVGIEDDFFALGGHSLLATRLISAVRDAFDTEVPLRLVFEAPRISEFAQEISAEQGGFKLPPITSAPIAQDLPLSFSQQRLWFVDQLQGGSAQYNIISAFKLHGDINQDAIEKALEQIITRHHVLRTNFKSIDAKPTAVVNESFNLPIQYSSLDHLSGDTLMQEIEGLVTADTIKPFDLSSDLMLRTQLIKLSGDCHLVMFNMHHIASDGWSMNILVREFSQLYQANCQQLDNPLAPLSLQYSDFAYWQRQWLQGEILETQLAYWQVQLENIPAVHSLPLDNPRPAVQTFKGDVHNCQLSVRTSERITAFCLTHRVTPFILLQTAFALLISRYSNQQDILITTAVAGRIHKDIEPLIGFLVNDLVIRTNVSDELDFHELLTNNRKTILDAFEHQHIPFQMLVEKLQPQHSLSHLPLSQIKFDLQNSDSEDLDLQGLGLEGLEFSNTGNIDYDLYLNMGMLNGQYSMSWRYYTAIFSPQTIARIAENFMTLIESVVTKPQQNIHQLSMINEVERNLLLQSFNDTTVKEHQLYTASQLFEQCVEKYPNHVAVAMDDERISYAQLNESANQLAHYLREQEIGPDTLVALCIERSIEMIIGIIAVLKAGGAYVPIDPTLPQARIEHMLEDSECSIVLTQTELMSDLPVEDQTVLPIDADMREMLFNHYSTDNIDLDTIGVRHEHLAYVIYTSGSTGKPKGVMIEQRGLTNLITGQHQLTSMTPQSNQLQFASLSFDASVAEWAPALSIGAQLTIIEDKHRYEVQSICDVIEKHQVTHAILPPALFHRTTSATSTSLQSLIFAGEALNINALRKARNCFTNCDIINAYGPTENSVCATAEILAESDVEITIGKPIFNVKCVVVNNQGYLCPIGVEGQLCLAGKSLARGYRHLNELTEQQFIQPLDPTLDFERLYLTGDKVKWLPDGKLSFIGRIDQQIKIRGRRIEVDEIKEVLNSYNQIEQGLVNVYSDAQSEQRLVAYFQPKKKVELWPSIAEFFMYDYFAYRAMFTHYARNDMYKKVLMPLVGGKIVLDIGPGPEAVLSRLCIDAGAKHVYAVDILESTYQQAKTFVESLGLSDQITLINADITKVTLPEKVDYCVSEIVGSIAGSEGSMVLIDSAKRLLKDPRNMIPSRSITRIAAVTLDQDEFDYAFAGLAHQYAERIADDYSKAFQFRLSLKNFSSDHVISSRDVFEDLDYRNGSPFELEHDIYLEFNQTSVFNGLLVWMDLFIDDDVHLDILEDPASWLPIYFPISCEGHPVKAGDHIKATITRRLCENGVNPDFMLAGTLYTEDGREIEVNFDSFHHALDAKPNEFYDKLFDSNGEFNRCDTFTLAGLNQHMASHLPSYMVPDNYVEIEQMPLTHNGKIDSKALPKPDESTAQAVKYVPPSNDQEQRLCDIWQEVLDIEKVGIDDDFFHIGGHSLLGAKVISMVRDDFAIEVPMRVLFEAPTVRGFVDKLEELKTSFVLPPIEAQIERQALPLSFAQQRLWFIDQLVGPSNQYNIFGSFKINGQFNIGAFEQALNCIIDRHEVLRTHFVAEQGEPQLRIIDDFELPLKHTDLSGLDKTEQQLKLQTLVDDEIAGVFDLSNDLLLRLQLIKLTEQNHVVLFNMHHIASDGWSMSIVVRELNALYGTYNDGGTATLPPLNVQYSDYAYWQRQWLQGEVLQQQMHYWQQQLQDLPQVHNLLLDRPRPSQQTFNGATHVTRIDETLTEQIRQMCKTQDVTLFMFMQTAFAVLLSRYSNETDIVIGSPTTGRVHKDTEGLIGFFINSLTLRSDLLENPSFDDLLQDNKKMILAAFEHQHVPFEMLVEALRPERSLSYGPLVQIYFTMQGIDNSDLSMGETTLESLEQQNHIIRYDLEFDVAQGDSHLTIDWKYNTDLFNSSTLERMAENFMVLLSSIITQPQTQVTKLPLLSEKQSNDLMHQFATQSNADEPIEGVCQWFEQQVADNPHALAVVYQGQELSYKTLDEHANQLAHYLINQGLKPDTLVALCLSRSLDMMIAMLGVLKAGAAYVPLDPKYPRARLAFLLQDSDAQFVLTQTQWLNNLPITSQHTLCLDSSETKTMLAKQPTQATDVSIDGSHLAYVIYTSGTTGQPKGVMIEHQALTNYVKHVKKEYLYRVAGSVVSLPIVFDATVTTLLAPLCHGQFVELLPDGDDVLDVLKDYLLDDEDNLLFKLTPAHLEALAAGGVDDNPDVEHVIIVGGEQLPVSTMSKWHQYLPAATFINEYGPTESTVGCSIYEIDMDQINDSCWINVPIGKPIDHVQLLCLDEQLNPVPIGVAGQLYIGGDSLAKGYLNRADLSEEKFISNPYSNNENSRLYQTGDMVCWLDNGQLSFLGRNDSQVKVRGYRIELGEIESVLSGQEMVDNSVVVAHEQNLLAYVVPEQSNAYPVKALIEMDKQQKWDSVIRKSLPNGMVVGCLNAGETDFTFDEIFIEQTYLKHGIVLQPNACIFDVGANTGMFSLFASQVCPSAKLVTFEPMPKVFNVLSFNAHLYDLNIRLYNCGISDKNQQATFTFYPYNSLISGRYGDFEEDLSDVKTYLHNQQRVDTEQDQQTTQLSDGEFDEVLRARLESEEVVCQLRTISEVIALEQIEQIDLLKLDVEKSEMDALRGIDAADWPKIKQLIVEVHDIGTRLRDMESLLESHGFNWHLSQEKLLEGSPLYVIYAIHNSYKVEGATYHSRNESVTKYPWCDAKHLSKHLRQNLSDNLPPFMVPSMYMYLDSLPLTVNGKLDYQALPKPQSGALDKSAYVAPTSESEKMLAQAFSDVLSIEVDKISAAANFFELGGHSLIAITLIANIKKHTGAVLPVKAIFEQDTLADLAQEFDLINNMSSLEQRLDNAENTIEIEI